ncbi:MOSC domain-containing protein [Planomonospora sp. ID67723]|nr:MOSC domain-containing protein [Planomonospora sp. ID67723]
MAITVGTVERIWRYPIKSTGGESLERVVAPGPVRLGDPVTLI